MDLLQEAAGLGQPALTRISVRSGVTFVVVQAASVRERQAQLVADDLNRAADAGGGRVAVCLSDVTDLCTALINVLLSAEEHCRALGGRLVVFGLSRELSDLFRSTGLDKRITLARDCTHAIKRMQPREPARRWFAWPWPARRAA